MDHIFSSKKRTFLLLFAILVFFMAIFTFCLFYFTNNFYNNHTDDFQQYFAIMEDFTIRLKNGNLSFYSFNNYLGSSIFGDAYYIPLDIFSFLATLLSIFMKFEFAFGTTELIKMVMGVMAFAYYLSLRGNSNKSIFFVSLIYMICGGNVILMAFPTYYSLIFYIPFGLICLEMFLQKKRYIIPIMACVLVFFDFYLAYLVLMFIGIMYVISIIERMKKDRVLELLKEFGSFIGLAFLGVLMGMVVLLPSAMYILRDTYRSTDTFYLFTFFHEGIVNMENNSPMAYFTHINDFDQLFRVIAETFTPNIPIGYYGFQNSYITDHLSMFITTTGFISLLFVYSIKKDRLCTIYKILLPFEFFLVTIPLFYMLFSGNGAPYARWLLLLNVFNLIILARVFTLKKFKLELHSAGSWVRVSVIILVILVTIAYFTVRLYSPGAVGLLGQPNSGSLNDRFKYLDFISEDGFIRQFLNLFGGVLNGTNFANQTFSQFPYLQYDVIFMFVSLGIIVILFGVSYIKSVNFIPIFLCIEIVYGMCFMCYNPLVSKNYVSIMNKRDLVTDYLDEYLPYDGSFQRVIIGDDIDEGLENNIARTSEQITNLDLFHSFYDANANEFTKVFFSKEEGAGKHHIEEYDTIYMDILLGRKYMVVKSDSLIELPSYYKYVNGSKSTDFCLYELQSAPFVVYDSYASSSKDYLKGGKKYSPGKDYTFRQAYFLNNLYYVGDDDLGLKPVSNDDYELEVKRMQVYNADDEETPWNTYIPSYNGLDYLGYNVENFLENPLYQEEGIMKFYFSGSQTDYKTEKAVSSIAYLGYMKDKEPVMISQCTDNTCYYDKSSIQSQLIDNQLVIFVQNTDAMRKIQPATKLRLTLEFSDYTNLNEFFESQEVYSNQKATISGSSVNISFDRTNEGPIVALIPITYNKNWKIDNPDYKVINASGGLIGVLISDDNPNVSFKLTYKPSGLWEGALISGGAFIVFGIYIGFTYYKHFSDYYATIGNKKEEETI